ncbi:VC0807 family protein [Paenibacillus hunanensis]|uniref:VC0807 family protein n=1 Tax=Paenibacillus hunanensis TaxID=539262 RepID=UPI002A6A8AFA|nr:VC0807 family protein [Paenibacillus hunanensis]WPP41585.1 VC0807 family protein [Paenibacillus hunanensis]
MSTVLKSRKILFNLIINGLIPWLGYVWLAPHIGSLLALSIVMMIPLIDNLIHLARHRKMDVFNGLMLAGFVLSLVMVLMGGSEKLLLMRESLVTVMIGLAFLGSLLLKRPLIYHMASRFSKGVDPERNWEYPYFRQVMRRLTLLWGVALVVEAGLKLLLINVLSTSQMLAISSPLFYAVIGLAIVGTIVYKRRAGMHMKQLKQHREQLA